MGRRSQAKEKGGAPAAERDHGPITSQAFTPLAREKRKTRRVQISPTKAKDQSCRGIIRPSSPVSPKYPLCIPCRNAAAKTAPLAAAQDYYHGRADTTTHCCHQEPCLLETTELLIATTFIKGLCHHKLLPQDTARRHHHHYQKPHCCQKPCHHWKLPPPLQASLPLKALPPMKASTLPRASTLPKASSLPKASLLLKASSLPLRATATNHKSLQCCESPQTLWVNREGFDVLPANQSKHSKWPGAGQAPPLSKGPHSAPVQEIQTVNKNCSPLSSCMESKVSTGHNSYFSAEWPQESIPSDMNLNCECMCV